MGALLGNIQEYVLYCLESLIEGLPNNCPKNGELNVTDLSHKLTSLLALTSTSRASIIQHLILGL